MSSTEKSDLTDEAAEQLFRASKYPLLRDTAVTLYRHRRKSMGVDAAYASVRRELFSDADLDAIRSRPFDLL